MPRPGGGGETPYFQVEPSREALKRERPGTFSVEESPTDGAVGGERPSPLRPVCPLDRQWSGQRSGGGGGARCWSGRRSGVPFGGGAGGAEGGGAGACGSISGGGWAAPGRAAQ